MTPARVLRTRSRDLFLKSFAFLHGGHSGGYRSAWLFALWTLCLSATTLAQVGQEMRQVQESMRGAAYPSMDVQLSEENEALFGQEDPILTVDESVQPSPLGQAQRPLWAADKELYLIRRLEIRGDAELIKRAGLENRLRRIVEGRRLTPEQLANIAISLQKDLIAAGYVAAAVSLPEDQDPGEGTAVLAVRSGLVGSINLYDWAPPEQTELTPFSAVHFSREQVEREFAALVEGDYFNYRAFRAGLLELNRHPDLKVDADLRVRDVEVDGEIRRFVDLNLKIEESNPLHAVIQVANDGSDITEAWRGGLMLQHLNLTGRDDVLTLSFPFSLDFDTIRSFAASYNLPHHAGSGGDFTVYGGYTTLDAKDILGDGFIDSKGSGWFAGLQSSYVISRTEQREVSLVPGFAYRVIENDLILRDDRSGDQLALESDITITPLSLGLSYQPKQTDRGGGRNHAYLEASFNPGDALGGSGDDDFALQRPAASPEYAVLRIRLARLQSVPGSQRWSIYGRGSFQYAGDALISAEQFPLGGVDSVRGYPERVLLGDDGGSFSIELRSPAATGLLPGGKDRWQAVAFADAGFARLEGDAANGLINRSDEIYSIGLGLRLQVASHTQVRADWGFPLVDDIVSANTDEEIESSGRGHFSLQVQF